MEILVVMFIMFVLSKLFGGIAQPGPQDQRRKDGRPFPNIPSEWNFPRPADILMEEPEMADSEAPRPINKMIDAEQEKKTKKIIKKPEMIINNMPDEESQGNLLGNLLAPDNIMSGIILVEVLKPPKSRRGTH